MGVLYFLCTTLALKSVPSRLNAIFPALIKCHPDSNFFFFFFFFLGVLIRTVTVHVGDSTFCMALIHAHVHVCEQAWGWNALLSDHVQTGIPQLLNRTTQHLFRRDFYLIIRVLPKNNSRHDGREWFRRGLSNLFTSFLSHINEESVLKTCRIRYTAYYVECTYAVCTCTSVSYMHVLGACRDSTI